MAQSFYFMKQEDLGSSAELRLAGQVKRRIGENALIFKPVEKLEQKIDENRLMFELAEKVEQTTEESSLVIAVDGNDPTLLYLSHRKGWHAHPDQVNDAFIEERAKKGAQYIVGNHSHFGSELQQQKLNSLLSNYRAIFNDGRSFIVKTSRSNSDLLPNN